MERRAALKRPSNGTMLCRECFYAAFENEVHETIVRNKLFKRGEKVAIAASGGKGAVTGLAGALANQRSLQTAPCLLKC